MKSEAYRRALVYRESAHTRRNISGVCLVICLEIHVVGVIDLGFHPAWLGVWPVLAVLAWKCVMAHLEYREADVLIKEYDREMAELVARIREEKR